MATNIQHNFEFFTNFMTQFKCKCEHNVNVKEPLHYVDTLFEKIKSLDLLEKVDHELIEQLTKECQKILENEEILPEDHIFPHLLKLAQYFVSFIKNLNTGNSCENVREQLEPILKEINSNVKQTLIKKTNEAKSGMSVEMVENDSEMKEVNGEMLEDDEKENSEKDQKISTNIKKPAVSIEQTKDAKPTESEVMIENGSDITKEAMKAANVQVLGDEDKDKPQKNQKISSKTKKPVAKAVLIKVTKDAELTDGEGMIENDSEIPKEVTKVANVKVLGDEDTEKSQKDHKISSKIKKPVILIEQTKDALHTASEGMIENDSENNMAENVEELEDEEEEMSERDQKILAKIEKYDQFCIKAQQKITELEDEELSLNEMDSLESNYIKDNILKKRFTEAYKRLRRLCKENPHLIDGDVPKKFGGQFSRPIVLKDSRYPKINEKITKNLDKTKSFPDFFDICEWVTEANEEAKLNLSKDLLEQISKSSFKEIGKILKDRRRKDMEMSFNSRLKNNEAESNFESVHKDEVLIRKLNNNKKIASEKETSVIDSFASKQETDTIAETDSKTGSEDEDSLDEKANENEAVLNDSDIVNSKSDSEDDEISQVDDEQPIVKDDDSKISRKRPFVEDTTQSLVEKRSFESPRKTLKMTEPLTPGSSNKMGISILSVSSASSIQPKIEPSQTKIIEQDSEDACIVLD